MGLMHGAPHGSMSPEIAFQLFKHHRWEVEKLNLGSVIVAPQPEAVRAWMSRHLTMRPADDAFVHETKQQSTDGLRCGCTVDPFVDVFDGHLLGPRRRQRVDDAALLLPLANAVRVAQAAVLTVHVVDHYLIRGRIVAAHGAELAARRLAHDLAQREAHVKVARERATPCLL